MQCSEAHSTADGYFIDCGAALDVQFSGHFPQSPHFLTCPDGDVSCTFPQCFVSEWIFVEFLISILHVVTLLK